MHTSSKITESGILEENGDTWLLVTSGKIILVDIPFFPDFSLEKHRVTILGKMGIPSNSPFEKLIADKIISHELIAKRAYEFYLANQNRSADENWFHAEKELLGI
jgi:hypothetical protein